MLISESPLRDIGLDKTEAAIVAFLATCCKILVVDFSEIESKVGCKIRAMRRYD
jgi:hypothetical protein